MSKMLTIDDLCEILQLRPNTIRNYLKEGKIRGSKFGREWRVKQEDLDKFIEDNSNTNK
ncbi:helix-turn-helix domain-containing protein [Halobacillus naozhouensis]|uniref:Helix-turn-helix domain-containing protein n=1 Tax=Halobacillus naozhouensis TaxID=554880 RepID=A0ABY8J3M5_9BACI|nr:helix-turn-helix domain-containing protein [Halobacillus naozhouensis]WFT77099.1 helix-turn-helix domain-containing protein [Halobacillus naozhouensis]